MVTVLNDQDRSTEAGAEFPLVPADGDHDSALAPHARASFTARTHPTEHTSDDGFISRLSVVCKHREDRRHSSPNAVTNSFFIGPSRRGAARRTARVEHRR